MPAIVRVGDPHACGAVAIAGSPNVFVNGMAVHRVGDADSHGTVQAEGSPNFFVNGRAVGNADALANPESLALFRDIRALQS